MKSSSFMCICTFSIAMIVFQSFGVQSVDAQERMFGNGRFLKRMFNDIVPKSASPKLPTPAPAAKKGQLKTKAPTAARRPSQNAQPTLANQAIRPRTANPRSVQPARSEASRDSINRLPKSSAMVDADRMPTRSSAKATLGFGMLVKLENEKLYVAQLDPQGSAADAGVLVGDRLVAGGGIKFESLADFNGVGDILQDGDQLEFELERNGSEKEMMIVYGKAPEDQAAMIEGNFDNKSLRETTQRRSMQAPRVEQINTRNNNSFLPTKQNVQVQTRNQDFLPSQQQSTKRVGASQTMESGLGAPAPSLQLPASAESVLN